MSLDGLYPALLTPTNHRREFVPDVAVRMLESLIAAGVDGVYLAGTTGEGFRLPLPGRCALVETVMQALPSDRRAIVHVGAPDLHQALSLAEHAAANGVHAISSLPPDGDSASVRRYYEELARHSDLPLVIYYFPRACPQTFITPEDLYFLCDLPNIVAVKFTDFNLYLLQTLASRGTLVFNGYDEVFAAGLLMGANGGIGSTYNIMPQVYLAIRRAAQHRDWETARIWQSRANIVIATMMGYPFFPALRAVMKHLGFDCGPLLSGDDFFSPREADELIQELHQVMPAEVAELIGWPSLSSVRS